MNTKLKAYLEQIKKWTCIQIKYKEVFYSNKIASAPPRKKEKGEFGYPAHLRLDEKLGISHSPNP